MTNEEKVEETSLIEEKSIEEPLKVVRKATKKRRKRRKRKRSGAKIAPDGSLVASKPRKPKKRRVGRPKKRGPKKKRKYISRKPKIDGRTCSKYKRTVDYKIIKCSNGRQTEYVGAYIHRDDAYKAFNEVIKENDKVIFPRMVRNTGKITRMCDECLLLEKNRSGEKENNFLRNEFGKLVEQKTNSSTWVVYDKAPILIEETFWVFGRNPLKERVDFRWIYAHLIKTEDVVSRLGFLRVIQYKNKLVIKDDSNDLEIVFCKTEGDAIRMYNLIEGLVKDDKLKNVLFLGSYSAISDKRRKLEEELCEHTGFSKAKIQLAVTKNCKR